MIELKIERIDVNVELLDAQLRAVGADQFYGLSLQSGAVILYLSDTTPSNVQNTLSRLTRQHDATQLTPQQEARAIRQRQIEQGRTRQPLDEKQYDSSPALIQALAAKIAWLEQEVRDLRGVS
jgi:hypothetical protein